MRRYVRACLGLPSTLLIGALIALVVTRGDPRGATAAVVTAMVAAGVALARVGRLRAVERRRLELREEWGKEDGRERDSEALSQRYETFRGVEAGSGVLDDATWHDLNMDDVFASMDRTHTNAGEFMLYAMLRQVVLGPEVLGERAQTLRVLGTDAPLREGLCLKLDGLGRDREADLVGLLWGTPRVLLERAWVYRLLAGLAVLCVLSPLAVGSGGLLFFVLPMFLINSLAAHVVTRDDVLVALRTLRNLGRMVETAVVVASLPGVEQLCGAKAMGERASSLRGLAGRIRSLNPEAAFSTELFSQVFYYVSVFFLVEVRTLNRVMTEIERHRSELRELVKGLGDLDALQSVASFRAGLASYCEPEFVEEARALEITDGWHPLVASPVANSIRCEEEGLFVTGSNMAGKSTFLRTVAVNVVMAQTINTCCAAAYRGARFRLISSISHEDELTESTSFFLAEAKRLLLLLERAREEGLPCLCVIDEMLRGTNSAERHAASLAMLRFLARTRAVVIVASHDAELGQMLQDSYRLWHFSESFNREQLEFDYRLKPGICAAGNALRTLEWVGFPEDAMTEAREHLARIQERGGAYTAGSQSRN